MRIGALREASSLRGSGRLRSRQGRRLDDHVVTLIEQAAPGATSRALGLPWASGSGGHGEALLLRRPHEALNDLSAPAPAYDGERVLSSHFTSWRLVSAWPLPGEFAIGRRGRGSAISAIRAGAAGRCGAREWPLVGALGILTGFLILSFYSVIGGWPLAHGVQTALDGFAGGDPTLVRAGHDALLAAPWRLLAYHGAFMLTVMIVVGHGVQRGIEVASMILMPVLAALMVGLAAYSMIAGDVTATLRFLFSLDPASLSARAALEALGLGFFSIGVGLGLMIA
jgi:hypothetical protein